MMRVTTQMIHDMAKKSGLPIRGTSLLDYVRDDNQDDFFASALNKSSASSKSDIARTTSYENLEKAADQLLLQLDAFTKEGEDSVFEKARKDGSLQEVYDAAEAFVKSFNDMAGKLKASPDSLNGLYRQSLMEVVFENSDALAEIGMKVSKNGLIALDKDALKEAGLDSLEKVLGASGDFSPKVSILASKIADNAQAGVESILSQYTCAGSSYAAMFNKYDFFG